MKKNVLFFAAIFFLLALVSCNKANPSSEEGTIAQETTLNHPLLRQSVSECQFLQTNKVTLGYTCC